jgi:hypothetical protein
VSGLETTQRQAVGHVAQLEVIQTVRVAGEHPVRVMVIVNRQADLLHLAAVPIRA